MNCKASRHISLFFGPFSRLFPWALLLAIIAVFSTGLMISAPSSQAASQFSLPSLKKLQRKFLKRKRRRRSKRSRKSAPSQGAAQGAALSNDETAPLLPPLPVRKPVQVRKAKPLTNLQRKARLKRRKNRRANRPRLTTNLEENIGALPPPPTQKPRRHPSKVVLASWSPALIKNALAQCKSLGIKAAALPPVQKGRCGNPAPVLLARLNIATIRPAATLSCPMAASLDRWFTQEVQPLALQTFGVKVVQIRNISSYVCRNRYGDTKTKISEHAYANALDIAWFELQGGEKISVRDDWDEPQGDAADNRKSAFLHALHKSACKLFGTVLGPDANAAHKDHFHLDHAPRRRSNYCR